MSCKSFIILFAGFAFTTLTYALELGNESTADKADRFEFEEFHKEKGITLWEEKKEKAAVDEKQAVEKNLEKGQELNVREAYKLGNDPALRHIQSLYDATEALHRQLNAYCSNGWTKDKEWHKPEQNYFYVHYSAVCL